VVISTAKGTLLSNLLNQGVPLPPAERAHVLEESAELERAHRSVAVKGDTAAPEHGDVEVECHYLCFVRSQKDGHLYELDGDLKGPTDTGVVLEAGQDVLCEDALKLVKQYIDHSGNVNFGLLALVKN
jgi:ubiquitin carboxyl-terminal hydrolase L3